ncbi:MAG: hypothetical protein ACLPT4_02405 [Verrucomicrobiia bacterium]
MRKERLIRPKRSIAPSRASIELKREYRFQTTPSGQGWAGTPIIASNFDTVGTMRMATALHDLNMLTCLHKYYPLEELIDIFVPKDGSAEAVGVAVEVMDIIAERRQRLFPDLHKIIVDYEVEIGGGQLTLNVTSAPIPDLSSRRPERGTVE